MKIVFPTLIAALCVVSFSACAEPFDCNAFPDFRARMSCYDVTSRGSDPQAEEKAATRSRTESVKTRRPTRRHARSTD